MRNFSSAFSRKLSLLALSLGFLGAGGLMSSASAAQCGGDFNAFVSTFSREAVAAGISPSVVSQSFAGVTEDPEVLRFDRRQRYTFNKTFEQYVSTRVGAQRIKSGRFMMQKNASLLSRIEQRFGVPPQI
ncbi:MAG: lytic murein transglycosylase, partial [Afipia sp.]|nr:lytic murein transglycosylase [Afipia sp.]